MVASRAAVGVLSRPDAVGVRAPGLHRGAKAAPVACLVLLACSACSSGPRPPSPGARADARVLARTLVSDSATSAALTRVDAMIGQERPVAAAEQLRDHAVPAAERTLRAVRATEPTTDDGRILKDTLVDAYVRRIAAMRAYADALSTTEEDFALLEALRMHRRREHELATAMAEVERTARGEAPAPPPTEKVRPPPAAEPQ